MSGFVMLFFAKSEITPFSGQAFSHQLFSRIRLIISRAKPARRFRSSAATT
jgi:hypothetical protein